MHFLLRAPSTFFSSAIDPAAAFSLRNHNGDVQYLKAETARRLSNSSHHFAPKTLIDSSLQKEGLYCLFSF